MTLLSELLPKPPDASGCQQLCGGQIAGIEAAVHATRSLFESDNCEVVDASNAFNTLTRKVALHNIRHLCPPIATTLINLYCCPTELFMDGDVILSQERTTQGDPLAMAMYGLATIKRPDGLCTQVWYADDSMAAGKLAQLREWWDKLESEVLCQCLQNVVDHQKSRKSVFADTGVNITPDGRPHPSARRSL